MTLDVRAICDNRGMWLYTYAYGPYESFGWKLGGTREDLEADLVAFLKTSGVYDAESPRVEGHVPA